MKIDKLGQVIATRELELSGSGKKVLIRFGRPKRFADGRDYYCPYQIVGLGESRVRYAGGVDGIQAIVLALQKIGAELYTSNAAKAGRLMWLGEGDLGIPVADLIADLVPRRRA
jgi:hypothetical protein